MRHLRILLPLLALLAATPQTAWGLPPWARRYNMNCSGCHTPAVPRLNATGIAFKWAGYRMPDEIGEEADMRRIENYLAARIVAAYDKVTVRDAEDEADGFSIPSASFFAAGPIGKRFGAYLEFDREQEGTIDLIGSLSGVWGREARYGGFRIGQGHLLFAGGGVAGFDRPTAISTPLAYDESLTSTIPLRLAGDQVGVEAFAVMGGRVRSSLQLLNGLVLGAGEEGAAVSKRDIVLTNQVMWDDEGSGLGIAAYLGNATGLIPADPTRGKRFYRLSATANKIIDRFEVMGGYVFGKDLDVPTGDTLSPVIRSPAGASYWVQGQYTAAQQALTVFGRYEFLDPDRDAAGASRTRTLVGAVVPMNLPEYFRWSIEVFRDSFASSASPQRTGLSTRLQVAF